MAFVPQFNGGQAVPVAQQNGPVLDREARPQIDAGSIMGALGASAESFSRFGQVGQPSMPLNAYDGKYQGVQAIVAGVQSLNDAVSRIHLQRAEAKNYADVTEAVTSMEVLREEFSQYQIENPNPEEWGAEWERRLSGFQRDYKGNKSLAPQAREQIDQRLTRFASLEAVRIDTEATKATFQRAAAAGNARYLKAVENGDLEAATSVLGEMEAAGYLHSDDRVAKEYAAREEIEGRQIEETRNLVGAALDRGQIDRAKELINAAPLRPDEKEAQIASIEKNEEQRQLTAGLVDRAYDEPDKVLEEIQDFDPQSGRYRNHPTLSGENRRLVERASRASIAEMQGLAMEDIQDRLATGEAQSIKDLEGVQYFDRLSAYQKAKIEESFTAPVNDRSEFISILGQIAEFDYAADNPLHAADLRTAIQMRFEGEYSDELLSRFDTARDEFEKSKESTGIGSGFTRAKTKIYQRVEDAMKAGAFGQYEVRYRDAQQVDQTTRNLRDAGKIGKSDFVEDMALKAKAADQAFSVISELERWVEKNPEATPFEMEERMSALLGDKVDNPANSIIEESFGIFGPSGSEASLFPDGSGEAITDADKQLLQKWQSLNPTR